MQECLLGLDDPLHILMQRAFGITQVRARPYSAAVGDFGSPGIKMWSKNCEMTEILASLYSRCWSL